MRILPERYFHAIDGRMRLRVEGVKGNPLKVLEVEAELADLPGLTSVNANPKTGNVLILYDPEKLTHWRLVAHLRGLGYLQEAHLRPEKPSPACSACRKAMYRRVATGVLSGAAEFAVKRALAALI